MELSAKGQLPHYSGVSPRITGLKTELASGRSTADQSLVKRTLVLFSIAGAFAGCGFLGPQEQVRREPGRTTYRVPEDNSLERPDITPVPEKVPGESR
jgi:hypothetical protein